MRAHGIDFSKWALNWDMPDNPPLPIDFAIQRVSWAGYTDERYENHSKKVNQCSARGAYHYYSSGVPWLPQAELFLKNITENPDTTYQMAWLDYETGYNKLTRRTSEEARKIVEFVASRFGGKVGLYANLNTVINYLDKFGAWMLEWPFWVAHYWFFPSPNKNPGWKIGRTKLKRAEGNWQFWQYRSDGDASKYGIKGKKGVDLNVFNGTVEELREWLGLGAQETQPVGREVNNLDAFRNEILDEVIEKVEELRPKKR
jgi:GH25 family lysozyme M1 (1,4-beta-N-acetylmuramidase)